MDIRPTLWILLLVAIQDAWLQQTEDYYDYFDAPPTNCSTSESIKGGRVTYSQGGLPGSVLTYHCGPGRYAFPVRSRLCSSDGEWSRMRGANGRLVSRATCKDVLCPGQLQLDSGDLWPRDQWFAVGTTQSFSCQEGLTLHGSAQRNCTISGEWTGTMPVCDNHAEDCDDPGVPAGALRSGTRFQTGEKVTYRCQSGLVLLGSAERVCLENREWSGALPRCQGQNAFDSPAMVAAAMAGSLAGVMDVLTPESKKKVVYARTFRVAEGSRMNIYILLDASGSITEQDFVKSKEASIALIRKLDSYEVQMKFHVLSFASDVIDVVDIRDEEISGDADSVVWALEDFSYNSHGAKTGTNLHAALERVSELMAYFKRPSSNDHFNETQNIIVIQTDGFSNTGRKPQMALARIRQLLGYDSRALDHTEETQLDVYAFGIGADVNKNELNSLASHKSKENHVFILKDYTALGSVFNSIISDQSVTMCGVAQEDVAKAFSRPWHVSIPAVSCSGTIVSENYILTAAHCFARKGTDRITEPVEIKPNAEVGWLRSQRVILHPQYNIKALSQRNVSEFYDYDVALVQLEQSIPLSWRARPICMPCTVPASRAMKKFNSTCSQHKKELLSHRETPASFIHTHSTRKGTHVHMGEQRAACVEEARQTLREPTDVTLEEYVPRRFLCSGSTQNLRASITCKGDSGGSLFLEKRKRYFQVGVVSWGTINVCAPRYPDKRRYGVDNPPPGARDFHINLFEILPWLKQHLGEEIQFLPEED